MTEKNARASEKKKELKAAVTPILQESRNRLKFDCNPIFSDQYEQVSLVETRLLFLVLNEIVFPFPPNSSYCYRNCTRRLQYRTNSSLHLDKANRRVSFLSLTCIILKQLFQSICVLSILVSLLVPSKILFSKLKTFLQFPF